MSLSLYRIFELGGHVLLEMVSWLSQQQPEYICAGILIAATLILVSSYFTEETENQTEKQNPRTVYLRPKPPVGISPLKFNALAAKMQDFIVKFNRATGEDCVELADILQECKALNTKAKQGEKLQKKVDTHLFYLSRLVDGDCKSLSDAYQAYEFLVDQNKSSVSDTTLLHNINTQLETAQRRIEDLEEAHDTKYIPHEESESECDEMGPVPVSDTLPTLFKCFNLMTAKQLKSRTTAESRQGSREQGYKNKEQLIFALCIDMSYDPEKVYERLIVSVKDELPLSIAKRELHTAGLGV